MNETNTALITRRREAGQIAHYAAAKSAFVALRDKVGPISLLDTPSIRTANRKADAVPADSLAAQVRSENPLAAQYADTILRPRASPHTPAVYRP